MNLTTRTATAAVAASALLGGGVLLAAGPASADPSTGLKSATICVTAPDNSNVLAHTRIIALSWDKQNYRETSVKKVDSTGCATVFFGTTGKVRFRAVGITHDRSSRTTKTYRAHWATQDAATLADPYSATGELKLVKTVTR